MAILKIDGSATVGTTEFSAPNASTTLTPQTDHCEAQTLWDVANMGPGDQYRFRRYEKVNGGAQGVVWEAILTGSQPGPLVTPKMVVTDGWDETAKKLAGTDRSLGFSVRKLWPAGFVTLADASLTAVKIGDDVMIKPLASGTASAGAAQTITLAGASTTAQLYRGRTVYIINGTGKGQARRIVDYTTGRVATVHRLWDVVPDATSVFLVIPAVPQIEDGGSVQADGGNSTLQFKTDRTESTDIHSKAFCNFITGALAGQVRQITGYAGATKIMTFTDAFAGTPSAGDRFEIINR